VIVTHPSIARPQSDRPLFNDLDRLDTTRMCGLEWSTMEPSSETSSELITLQLAPAELLTLCSFLALGAHFAAITSGENSPLSPDELRSHIVTIGEVASSTLTGKLVAAVEAVRERERHLQQLPPSPEVDEI
jgi:hypothetical protein